MSAVLSSILVLGSLFYVYKETRHEINEVYDARLGQSAKTLALALMSWGDAPLDSLNDTYRQWLTLIERSAVSDDSPTPMGHPYEQNLLFQYLVGGKVLVKSPNAPDTFIGEPDYSGFSIKLVDGHKWRTFQMPLKTVSQQQTGTVLVAERVGIRNELIDEVSLSIGLPQLILIPILILLIIVLINRSFRPISELRAVIADRSINNLERVVVSHPTTELDPLVNQLNFLFAEVENAWRREKRLIRTAAHELKTPLAVLRLDTENALMTLDESQRQDDLKRILAGIERTDRVIQQLLMLSRVEQQKSIMLTPLDAVEIARESIANLVPMALKNKQTISLSGEDSVAVNGHQVMLPILMTNLIDNAIRYAGEGAQIDVEVTRVSEGKVLLTVTDSGEAMREEVRSRLFEKFYRGNSEKGDGAGLGMSIVKDIADLHGATIVVEAPVENDKGNRFSVQFPLA
ncbi:sensor histidine kinase [Enterovibrio sp. NIFS-20-8]|nr:sensor histidine kinase [Enterovibrio paralichthyis]